MSSTQNQYETGALPGTGALSGGAYRFAATPSVLPAVRERVFSRGAVASCITVLLLAAMFAMVAGLFWFPVKRSLSYQDVNFNEGWNVYHQEMAAKGIPLYGALRTRLTGSTGYPPLSFHLVGWLGEQIGSYTQAGRRVALIALLATGVLLGLTIWETTRNRTAAVFSCLLYLMGIVLLMPSRLAMNDPQAPAEALAAAGIYLYLKNNRCARLLCLSALAIGVGGFYKHSIIAIPLAIGLDLLLHSLRPSQPKSGMAWSARKSFFIWTGALLATCAALAALTIAVDGPYFFQSLTGARAYLYFAGVKNIHNYLSLAQFPLLLAVLWCFYSRSAKRSAVVTLLLLTHATAFYFCGGDGVDLNIFYDSWFAVVLACGMALAGLGSGVPESAAALRKPLVPAMAMLALFAGMLVNIPRNTFYEYKQARFVQADEREFRSAVGFLKATPGPALCESLLLCYESGREYSFDPYYVRGRMMLGRIHESEINDWLRARRWKVIQVALNPADQENIASAGNSLAFKIGGYLQPSEVEVLLENYRLAMRTRKMLIFVPKTEPS